MLRITAVEGSKTLSAGGKNVNYLRENTGNIWRFIITYNIYNYPK